MFICSREICYNLAMAKDVFRGIKVTLPYAKIFRRLGYREGVSRLTPWEKDRYLKLIDEAFLLCDLKGVGEIYKAEITEKGIRVDQQFLWPSQSLKKYLGHTDEVLLLAATAGEAIGKAIKDLALHNQLVEAAVYDATASEVVDESLSWLSEWFNEKLRRFGKALSPRRFSAGYGDFALEHQADFFEILGLADLGISLNPSFMLVPEKSVTALVAVEKIS